MLDVLRVEIKPVSFLDQGISKHYTTSMNVWKRKSMQAKKVIITYWDYLKLFGL